MGDRDQDPSVQDKYKRTVVRPQDSAPAKDNEIRIKNGGRVGIYVTYALAKLIPKEKTTDGGDEQKESTFDFIVLKAMGRAINKAISVAEVVKRRVVGLHQITKVSTMEVKEIWKPLEKGLDDVENIRRVASVTVTLTKNPTGEDRKEPGYQEPLPENQVESPRQRNQQKKTGNYGGYQRSGGQQRGRRRNDGRRRGGGGYRGGRRPYGNRNRGGQNRRGGGGGQGRRPGAPRSRGGQQQGYGNRNRGGNRGQQNRRGGRGSGGRGRPPRGVRQPRMGGGYDQGGFPQRGYGGGGGYPSEQYGGGYDQGGYGGYDQGGYTGGGGYGQGQQNSGYPPQQGFYGQGGQQRQQNRGQRPRPQGNYNYGGQRQGGYGGGPQRGYGGGPQRRGGRRQN